MNTDNFISVEHHLSQVKETLDNIMADLVQYRKNELFLEQLFVTSAGEWQDLVTLCNDLPQLGLKEIQAELDEPLNLKVTWLDYSSENYDKGFCLIIFFGESLVWSKIAVYNKQLFCKRYPSYSASAPIT